MNQSKFVGRLRNVNVERKNDKTWFKILTDINFTLPAGSIIGLIGPSGGGKTTLLKTLIGLVPPKSGSIELGGYVNEEISIKLPPSFIGFMPQETALNEIWTGEEILQFCGRVHNIDQQEVDKRIDTLHDSIDLPKNLGFLLTMSGGQRRRVSLAMALLHRPTLLILDEPTVGSDPISRLKIWNFLEECRDKFGMTILVTTHYIEEVRSADSIAYMYKGHLIRHDRPEKLMKEFNCIELEKVALALCQKHSQSFRLREKEIITKDVFANYSKLIPQNLDRPSSAQLITASFIRLAREKYLNFIAPLLFCLWLHFVALILITFLQRPPIELSICVSGTNTQTFSSLTSTFFQSLNSSKQLNVLFCDLEDARTKASKNDIIGYLITDGNLGENLIHRATIQEDDYTSPPLWHFYADHSDKINFQFVERLMSQKTEIFIGDHLKMLNRSRAIHNLFDTIPIDGRSIDDLDSRLRARMTPLTLAHFCYQFSQASALFGILLDRVDGFLDRQKVMGIKPWHLIVAYLVRANIILAPMFVGVSSLFLLSLGFELDWYIFQFLVIHTAISICGNCTGIFLGTLSPSMSLQMVVLFSYHLGILWLNSAVWPNESIPYYMQPFTHIFPFDNLIKASKLIFMRQKIVLSFHLFAETLIWISLATGISFCIFK